MSEQRTPDSALQMVFVPLTRAEAVRLRNGEPATERSAHAATTALLQAHDYDDDSLEDADFAALTYAGVRAVLETLPPGALRLVLAAEVPPCDVVDAGDPIGSVRVRRLAWAGVRALFADEPATAHALAAAQAEVQSQAQADAHAEDPQRSLSAALALPAMELLVDEHDLLWFAPEELDHLPG